MLTYARVVDGIVVEIIIPPLDVNGDQYPIEVCYPQDFVAQCVDIAGIIPAPQQLWIYADGVFSAPSGPTDDALSVNARAQRDSLLSTVYDPGINMALRALRMASTPEETTYAEGKIEELDVFAEALIAIPDQPGFPQTIVWPATPVK